jgi:hypothetical protein
MYKCNLSQTVVLLCSTHKHTRPPLPWCYRGWSGNQFCSPHCSISSLWKWFTEMASALWGDLFGSVAQHLSSLRYSYHPSLWHISCPRKHSSWRLWWWMMTPVFAIFSSYACTLCDGCAFQISLHSELTSHVLLLMLALAAVHVWLLNKVNTEVKKDNVFWNFAKIKHVFILITIVSQLYRSPCFFGSCLVLSRGGTYDRVHCHPMCLPPLRVLVSRGCSATCHLERA